MKYYKQYKEDISCDIPLVIRDRIKEFWDDVGGETVRSEGTFRPIVMFVGMAPSKQDFELGIPFSDMPSQKLVGIISYISAGLEEPLADKVYKTFLCPELNDEDIELCKKRLEKEITLINPKCIVFIGESQLFREHDSEESCVLKIGGKWYDSFTIPCLRELFFKNEEVAKITKEKLDSIINKLNE